MPFQFDAASPREASQALVQALVYVARVPSCPTCGEMLLAPELSEFYGRGRIRHYWACDTCGTPSETSVKLSDH